MTTSDEIIEVIMADHYKRATSVLKSKIYYEDLDTLDEIVSKSLLLLYEKFLKDGQITETQRAIAIFYGIVRMERRKHLVKLMDQKFFADLSDEGDAFQNDALDIQKTNVALNPPSYYYNKAYRERVTASMTEVELTERRKKRTQNQIAYRKKIRSEKPEQYAKLQAYWRDYYRKRRYDLRVKAHAMQAQIAPSIPKRTRYTKYCIYCEEPRIAVYGGERGSLCREHYKSQIREKQNV